MSILQAFILGLVQGLTEFIPVSSSGHLVLLHEVFGIVETGLSFDVALHAGTLIALVTYFWQDIRELFGALIKKSDKTPFAYLLIIATIPAAVFGVLLERAAESTFRSVRLVACTMLVFGIIMLIAEWYYQRQQTHIALQNITRKQALVMGFAQAAALVPGVSRSGSTITAGLFAGLDRVAATRFSFMLGIPITFGAILKVFSEDGIIQQVQNDKAVFMVGILTALVSGLLAIRFMLRYLSKRGLHVFAYYRIILALGVLIAIR